MDQPNKLRNASQNLKKNKRRKIPMLNMILLSITAIIKYSLLCKHQNMPNSSSQKNNISEN